MEKIIHWWKVQDAFSGEKRYVTLVKSLLLALLPFVCCLVYCGAADRSIGEVYLPSSEWNDELFYYKQVEGIVSCGYPLGYFGFDESHALKLSFAAWSPALVFPWILWGLVFGWNLMSPVICNIVLMSLCCFGFVWLVRPSRKQLGILVFLFCLYTPFVRYMLSGMPEVICFSMLILFYALALNYLRRERAGKLAVLFALSGVMTLMRPYLVLFMLLPAYLLVRRERRRGRVCVGFIVSAAAVTAALGLYACIKHYFGAEYFAPLFFTDWAEAFFREGFLEGIRFTLGKLYYMGSDFLAHTREGLRTGLASGAFFAGYLVCLGVLAGQSLGDWRRRRRLRGESHMLVIEAHLAFSFIAMLFALLLMYKLTEGSKHLLTFMAAAVFVISLAETKFYKKAALIGLTFAYLYTFKAVDPYDYQVPFLSRERQEAVEAWEEAFGRTMTLTRSNAPGYENVVIWVFSDTVDGAGVNTSWQLLYALPEGFGISCCMKEYVTENFGELKSRYLAAPAGGEIDEMCREAGHTLLHADGEMALYRLEETGLQARGGYR